MGSPETEYSAALEAMRTSFRCNTYHNPMAMSQVLPALNRKSYLAVKHKQCLSEDGMWLLYLPLVVILGNVSLLYCDGAGLCADSLVLEPKDPVTELETKTTVNLTVKVVTFSHDIVHYYVDVPKGSTLLEALGILRDKPDDFT